MMPVARFVYNISAFKSKKVFVKKKGLKMKINRNYQTKLKLSAGAAFNGFFLANPAEKSALRDFKT